MIATDLLKESVDRLNINSQNADFRKNASGVIAAMLEARMLKKQQNGNAAKFDDPEFLPPPPPLPSTNPPLINNEMQDLPLPPPPSPKNCIKIPSSILTPPLSSDENDFPQKTRTRINGNISSSCSSSGDDELVNYRHKNHHENGSNIPSTCGINKKELSTHARDRRSYIERNNNGNELNITNGGGCGAMDKETLDTIAAGIANGQHPVCDKCKCKITRGPFVTALGRTWCPAHFLCVNPNCKRELMDIGFVEEKGELYCEYCFEQFLAPPCSKCNGKIKGDCLNAIGKKFHPECFKCTYCGKLFGNNPFFLEEGEAYCEADWNELFTTKCFACGFPVEAGDRWVEALNNNYHSQCFNCTYCKKNLEGQSFFAKGGRPFCKNHAR
ncbi:hypothetical protein PVAND_000970 [Polypedilum vanderplanki]|uniref:LIM zinc-binding domain-containing protein n=1 Tax=Polypedilum vanderplanki TaxID=319348 RepID=A0A9J6BMT8_POLVA|nr:hypothetical protein PVAND_000970 [Polypedilum vanderplanki]